MTKKLIYPLSVLFLLIANSCNGRNENPTNSNGEVSEDINVNTKFYLDIPADSLFQEDFIIKKGENLGLILSRFDVNSSVVEEIRVKSKDVFDITRLRAGNKYTILSDLNEGFAHYLVYEKNQKDHIVFDLRDSVNIYEYNKDISLKLCSAFGEINSSLWNVINKKGYDIALSDKLSEIYAWQIDFFGIAKGDNFKVLYDQAYIDDSVRIGIEDVKGAIFNHHGKDYYAIPFMQDSIVEFFDENGQSLRKAFLKAPLKYSRISSTFSNARKHPILKIVRPHHGVDYAAPVGTPVRTIGDGVITKKAFQAGGAGYYLKIKHNSSYETTYMHLSKFAAGIKEGKRVSQGDVIGYVGSSGGSTGPHLDFRVHFQGKPINPLKMESPPSLPVREELKDSFNIVKDNIIRDLKQMEI